MGHTDVRYGPSGQRLSAAVSSSNDILPGKAHSPLGQVTAGLLPGTLATAGQRTPQGAPGSLYRVTDPEHQARHPDGAQGSSALPEVVELPSSEQGY